MADTSRGRVTITLGRTGQVVKRPVTLSDSFTGSLPSAGNKRSVRERLGSNGDSSLVNESELNRKRRRGETDVSSRNAIGIDDANIGKDDLRYMLMRKNSRRRAESDDKRDVGDLREKLVKTVHPPAASLGTRQRIPEKRENGIVTQSRLPPSRSANDLPQPDPLRNSYLAWSLDHLRRRSPERYISRSRGLSPQRNVDELQRRSLMRTPDDIRSVPYVRRDLLDPPRSMSGAPYPTSATRPSTTMRPPALPLLGQNHPPGGSVRSSHMVNEHQSVDSLLNALELGKYTIIFKAEEVDMAALKQMGEHDLKELGIPMGPRKKILQAIQPRPKRQQ